MTDLFDKLRIEAQREPHEPIWRDAIAMKYQLGQVIHYVRDNKPHSAPILALLQIDNLHEDWASTSEQRVLFTPFGKAGVLYATCHGIVSESDVFATKAEMLESMLSPNV